MSPWKICIHRHQLYCKGQIKLYEGVELSIMVKLYFEKWPHRSILTKLRQRTQSVRRFLHTAAKANVLTVVLKAKAAANRIRARIQGKVKKKKKRNPSVFVVFCCSLSMTLMLNLTLTSLAGARQSLKVEMEVEQSRHAPYFINVTGGWSASGHSADEQRSLHSSCVN